MAPPSITLLTFLLSLSLLNSQTSALSTTSSLSEQNASRLKEALYSAAGKLTLSPEIIIPDPSDPTAILLQSTAIKTMSERIRTEAKANAAWISGSVTAVQTFCAEQEQARGNFPGPVPVIYCPSSANDCSAEDMESLVESGAAGILATLSRGEAISSADEISLVDDDVTSWCSLALKTGLQPIPEIILTDELAGSLVESDVSTMVEQLSSKLGFDPVSVVLTVNPPASDVDDDDDEDDDTITLSSLPRIPKSLGKTTPIIGSVRVAAGENRINMETARFKEAGFTGALLRSDCVPGFRMNPDLDIVGRFWSACIGSLKSTKSKSFSFQSKNLMEKNLPTEWAKYQRNIMDSGALGAAEDNYSPLDTSSGDYKGF